MARLTAKARRQIPKKNFAIPGKAPKSGSYPIHDRSHARAALSMVSRHGTSAEKAAVRRKVKAKYPGMGKK